MLFNIKSPVGCVNCNYLIQEGGFFSSIWSLIKYTFYFCLLYIILRTAYNVKVHGCGIIEAIPHKDLLKGHTIPKF